MKVQDLSREIGFKLHQFGLAGTLARGARRVAQDLRAYLAPQQGSTRDFDLDHGTDTSGVVQVGSLDLPAEAARHAVRYQTAISDVFLGLLKDLPISYDKYLFIDLGSGKGRALLLASNFPFKQIIGIELAPSLHETARKNISIYRAPTQRCHDIVSVCKDVAAYEIPSDNVVIYLFNPFDEQVIAAVLLNIERSLQAFRRSLYVVYLKAAHRQILDRSLFLRILTESPRYVIYQSQSS